MIILQNHPYFLKSPLKGDFLGLNYLTSIGILAPVPQIKTQDHSVGYIGFFFKKQKTNS